MEELEQRISVLLETGIVTGSEAEDLRAIVSLLADRFGFARSDELVGPLVTHIAAAFKRQRENEEVETLPDVVIGQLEASGGYAEAREIQLAISESMGRDLSKEEGDFVLLHVVGMLEREREAGR